VWAPSKRPEKKREVGDVTEEAEEAADEVVAVAEIGTEAEIEIGTEDHPERQAPSLTVRVTRDSDANDHADAAEAEAVAEATVIHPARRIIRVTISFFGDSDYEDQASWHLACGGTLKHPRRRHPVTFCRNTV